MDDKNLLRQVFVNISKNPSLKNIISEKMWSEQILEHREQIRKDKRKKGKWSNQR